MSLAPHPDNTIIDTLLQQNPSYQLGLIPNLMPEISLRDYSARAANDNSWFCGRRAA